jgi:predicted nucleic acid-binding protein
MPGRDCPAPSTATPAPCSSSTCRSRRRAEHFLLTRRAPLRAADALHLALAVSARAASLASFDARLAAVARATGLAIYPA